jgi:hypothetical protein
MGTDIHMHMGYKNKEVKLYKKEKNELYEVPIFDGRNSDLFDYIIDHCYPLDESLPIPDSIKEDYEAEEEWCYGFREITLADMALHIRNKGYFIVETEEWEGYKAFMNLFEQTKTYFELWNDEDYEPSFSNIKLYMWFDN